MLEPLIALLSDYTLQNVAMGAAMLGLVGGVLGVFAVLRRQSLLGDTLSHAALPGICLGFLVAGTRDLAFILSGALATGAAAAVLVALLIRTTRLKTDAALGIALSLFFALGVVLLTSIQNSGAAAQGGLESFLFGQAAAILRGDLYVMGTITATALLLVGLLWKEFKLVAFDPGYARTLGLPVFALELALTAMIALAVVVGLQMVGVVLMAAVVVAPAVAARQWSATLGAMVALSGAFGLVSGIAGAVTSALAPGLSTGPLIVLFASALVVLSIALAPGRGVVYQGLAAWRSRRALATQQVLTTLYRLAATHDNPAYPAEQSMVDAYHGVGTGRALAKLEARGLVARTVHRPEASQHWTLTPEGVSAARATLAKLGLSEDGS